ncbi:unnamed protein product [Cyprideis torosa]|uniref:Uncharacterized protein n=1 Tax=Cyprideis torosa TaxID=163714 RepID=A0A7R8ZP37_9CRUS|nr:unnamed protein product [Cyprideis torosa]CAG0899520.1 unnamed protein product [Cyprideis torosa]
MPASAAAASSSAAASTSAAGKREDVIRPMKSLFVRNIPADFDQARCEREFSQFPGFVSFQMLTKGKGSGFLNYDSIEHAISAKEEFARSILKVTFKGSTTCDECSAEVTKWVNCPCKGATYCTPRCLVEYHKKGHAADCKPMPTECQCLLGRKFPGAIRCVCQKTSWCSVNCLEKAMDTHEPNCIPRRFIPPALRQRFRQNRDVSQFCDTLYELEVWQFFSEERPRLPLLRVPPRSLTPVHDPSRRRRVRGARRTPHLPPHPRPDEEREGAGVAVGRGHAADCKPMPTECQCLLGRKFPGAIRCVCQKTSWCSVNCLEKAMDTHEPNCIPRRFIPPALRQRFRQNRDRREAPASAPPRPTSLPDTSPRSKPQKARARSQTHAAPSSAPAAGRGTRGRGRGGRARYPPRGGFSARAFTRSRPPQPTPTAGATATNVVKLRTQVTELKKEMNTVTKSYQKELAALRQEVQQLKLSKKGGDKADDDSAPVTLSSDLLPKEE